MLGKNIGQHQMPKLPNGLTEKQNKFVDEYLVDLNATQAAIRAGYSEKTAYSIGHENLSKPEIISALQQRRDEIAKTTDVTPERVLEEYAKIGFSDLRNALTSDGHLIDPHDWDDDFAAAVASVEVVKRAGGDKDEPIEYTHKIKTWDKKGALDSMARHLGMFVDKVEHTGKDGGPIDMVSDRDVARKLALILSKEAG